MTGGEVNPYPILVLVNYWEIRANRFGQRLDELLKSGINQFGAFVPWQAVESDVTHTLTRFLQAVSARRMTVHLILSPELGIHYPNSGIPKDIVSKPENISFHYQSGQSGKIVVNLPPNSFALPSVFAPEFSKRYFSFLSRLDSYFTDLGKNQPELLKCVRAVLTGSFWKYYRSPLASALAPFGGTGGDYSSHASVAYRQRVDQFYSQREFMDPTPSSANRWKTRSLEEMNRRWFYQQSEDIFRNRTFQTVRKRCGGLQIAEVEMHTPEADPSVTYSNFLQMVSGGRSDFSKLSLIISEAASRISFSGCSHQGQGLGSQSGAAAHSAPPFAHWTSMGGFRLLSEPEKQFLILKSLLLLGAQSGGFSIDEAEWFALSANFRTRAETLARSLSQGELSFKTRALYLVPHLWSDYGTLWEELATRLGPEAKMIASPDLIHREKSAAILVVDPSFILNRDSIHRLIAWAKSGRLVALPASQLYTQQAKLELEQLLSATQKIEVDLGLPFRLHAVGDGKLVVYDIPNQFLGQAVGQSALKGEPLTVWQNFLNAVLSVADVETVCRLSDSRLTSIWFERKCGGHALFVLNGTHRSVSADIIFPMDVQVEDFGVALNQGVPQPAGSARSDKPSVSSANRFSLDVPPMGILPMIVSGLDFTQLRERQIAAQLAPETIEGAFSSAATELPGFNGEDLWS